MSMIFDFFGFCLQCFNFWGFFFQLYTRAIFDDQHHVQMLSCISFQLKLKRLCCASERIRKVHSLQRLDSAMIGGYSILFLSCKTKYVSLPRQSVLRLIREEWISTPPIFFLGELWPCLGVARCLILLFSSPLFGFQIED